MEFTVGRRLVRRARTTLAVAAAGVLGAVVWLVASRGGGLAGPLALLGLSLAGLWTGRKELARSRQPFRLRVDDFGITLHDAELSWDQIDTVALHHPPLSDDESAPEPPLLVLWPAAGVTLPRKPDRGHGSPPATLPAPLAAALNGPLAGLLAEARKVRPRYTLVRTGDLDQSVGDLGAALARHAGARFETAPRAVRPPTPVSVAGPELRSHLPETVFTNAPVGAARTARGVAITCLPALAVALLLPLADVVLRHRMPFSPVLFGPWFAVTAAAWWLGVCAFRRWRRPLRLRVGPGGLAVRDTASEEFSVPWDAIAVVTIGPEPGTTGSRPWLIVWPVPGAALARSCTHVVDGHQAHALVRLDRLPGGVTGVVPVVRSFAGERFSG